MNIRFSAADLELFAAASHDRNPLHLSAVYARRAQFGQQVIYGVLGALAVIARTPVPEGHRLSKIALEFSRPIFLDTDYQISEGCLKDGSTTLLKSEIEFVPGDPSSPEILNDVMRETAAPLTDADLIPNLQRDGAYGPDPLAAQALWQRLDLDAARWGSLPLAALLWSSYLAGMEIPGERALYSRLTIRFESVGSRRGPLQWKARLKSRNALNLLRTEFALSIAGEQAAAGEIGVLLRPAPLAGTNQNFERSDQLAGKVALITGASRGLGADIARALALRGAKVLVNFQHSRAEAERLRDELPDGSIELWQGDASDVDWCQAARARISKLDFLVLNACPTVLPMRAEPATAARLTAYAARALALASVPLAVFAEAVQTSTVLISSAYVESLPKEFPHYVAAKAGAEAMLRTIARQHRGPTYAIIRPPKLLTDMTNTPYGSGDAVATERVASKVAGWLCAAHPAGAVDILDGVTLF